MSENKKYEFTGETKAWRGRILRKIRAIKDIRPGIPKGTEGGYIEAERNLSQAGDAWVYGNAKVFGNANVYGDAWVFGNAKVYGNAKVSGNAWVFGNANVYGNAKVSGNADWLTIGPVGSRNDFITFVNTNNGICVACGCFWGPIDQFENQVQGTHGDSKHGKAYLAAIEIAKCRIKPHGEEAD